MTRAVHPDASLNQLVWVLLWRPGLLAESAWRPRPLRRLGRARSPTCCQASLVCETVDGQQRCGNVGSLGERSGHTRPAAKVKLSSPLSLTSCAAAWSGVLAPRRLRSWGGRGPPAASPRNATPALEALSA